MALKRGDEYLWGPDLLVAVVELVGGGKPQTVKYVGKRVEATFDRWSGNRTRRGKPGRGNAPKKPAAPEVTAALEPRGSDREITVREP